MNSIMSSGSMKSFFRILLPAAGRSLCCGCNCSHVHRMTVREYRNCLAAVQTCHFAKATLSYQYVNYWLRTGIYCVSFTLYLGDMLCMWVITDSEWKILVIVMLSQLPLAMTDPYRSFLFKMLSIFTHLWLGTICFRKFFRHRIFGMQNPFSVFSE